MKKKLLWCMTALTALLSASCSSELALEGGTPNNVATGEEVDVTFSISADGTQAQTRAGGGPGVHQSRVGKGLNIDMLIYAVYEYDEQDGYTLLNQYGKGMIGYTENPEATIDPFTGTETAFQDGVPHTGQTIINVGDKFKNETGDNEVTIKLRLMRGKTYHIAFWAQSSKTDAFNTGDLENVIINYTKTVDGKEESYRNNDELRDAFCKVESFSVSAEAPSRPVILTRPMAQINVGTTGADYKNLLKGLKVSPTKTITQSKISLEGVAKSINVVTDQIDGNADNLTTVNFAYDIIPAFMYMKDGNGKVDFPQKPSKQTEADGDQEEGEEQPSFEELLEQYNEFYYKGKSEEEEFLKVDLDNSKSIEDYRTFYPTVDKDGNFLTETFKYLSMCYVLVPATSTTKEEGDEMPAYTSSVLKNVTVTFAETNENGEAITGNNGSLEYETINLDNVPVHRNWRTNILGGLRWMKDPTDPDPKDPDDIPEDPDDTTIFKYHNCKIILDELFYNEHNGIIGEEDEEYNKDLGEDDPKANEWEDYPQPEAGGEEVEEED